MCYVDFKAKKLICSCKYFIRRVIAMNNKKTSATVIILMIAAGIAYPMPNRVAKKNHIVDDNLEVLKVIVSKQAFSTPASNTEPFKATPNKLQFTPSDQSRSTHP